MNAKKLIIALSIILILIIISKTVSHMKQQAQSEEKFINDRIVSSYNEAKNSGKNVIYYFRKHKGDKSERRRMHWGRINPEIRDAYELVKIDNALDDGDVYVPYVKNELIQKCTERLCIINTATSEVRSLRIEDLDSDKFKQALIELKDR